MIVNFWDIETLAKDPAELAKLMPPEIKDPVMPWDLANPKIPQPEDFIHKGMSDPEKLEVWRSGKVAEWHRDHKEKIAKWNASAEDDRRKFCDKAACDPLTGTVCLIGLRTIFLGDLTATKRKGKKNAAGEKIETTIFCAEQIPAELAKEFGVVCFKDEATMLRTYWDTLRDWFKHDSGLINAGWNSNKFDLRFVRLRSAALGIKPMVPILGASGYPIAPLWLDLMAEYTCGDRNRYAKINEAARCFGIPAKEQDGSAFARLWANDKRGALAYLRDEDLRLTEEIGRRLLTAF